MTAARCLAHGPVETVTVGTVPVPKPGPDEVLVEVRAAAVNFPDALIVTGEYQVKAEPPFTPGNEFAGVIREVGRDVREFSTGDRVMGSVFTGAFAEMVVAPERVLTLVPDEVDFVHAAGFRVAYGTAYHALRTIANMKPGEWVVVLGAAGGVGSATVELATMLGGRVVAAASTDEKLDFCRSLGAEATVNYSREDLKVRLKEIADGGANVVIDPVGGPYSELALRAMRWGGRFVCVGFASGEIPRIPLNLLLLKGVWITGFEKRTIPDLAPEAESLSRRELVEWLAEGRIRPRVSECFGLERASDALARVAGRHAMGKVIIQPLGSTGGPPA